VTLPPGGDWDTRAWRTKHGVTLTFPTTKKPYYRLDYRDANGVRHQPSVGKDGALAWAAALDADTALQESVADPTGRTVGQMLDAWLPEAKKAYSPLHYEKYEDMVRDHIRPALGGLPAWPLSKEQVKACLDAAPSASARRHTENALGALLIWGHAEDWVASPREVFFPRQPRTAKKDAGRQHGETVQFIPERLRPNRDACRQFAEAMEAIGNREGRRARHGEKFWLMVAASASCGVRIGELLAAPVDNLDWATGEWFVDRQVIRPKSHPQGLITDPKWGRVRRTILPELTIWGEPFRDRVLAYAEQLPPGALLFGPHSGRGFIHASNFGRDYARPARVAVGGLWTPPKRGKDNGSKGWTWHSLRHAFCTDLLRRGAQDTDVALWAGHRDSHTTRAMYVGATEGSTARGNALLSATPEEGKAA
jgi:integrase